MRRNESWPHACAHAFRKASQLRVARLLDDGDAGPHIVVAPVSTLENWTREIALWCPALTCVKYHGSEAERDEIRQAVKENGTPHVVVCSFTTFSSSGASAPLDQKFLRKLDASYLIIDEAQKIKNANSITFKNLSQLKTRRRLLLTRRTEQLLVQHSPELRGEVAPQRAEQLRGAAQREPRELKAALLAHAAEDFDQRGARGGERAELAERDERRQRQLA